MAIKRSRDQNFHDEITNMANCLILLSGSLKQGERDNNNVEINRVFECKTCNRKFPSFQALGGHRASHKKPRLMDGSLENQASPPKPKTHECSICGLEFAIGQALGGHMRRHRAVMNEQNKLPLALSLAHQVPVVKKPNSRRVLCLDLNLTPLENKFLFGKIVNPVDFKPFF